MQDADRCKNPFVGSSGLEILLDRDQKVFLLDGLDSLFQLYFIVTTDDGRTRIID